MRILLLLVLPLSLMIFASSAMASLPHYNSEVGYTIWLPKGWDEAPAGSLDSMTDRVKPVLSPGTAPRWEAGYCAADGKGPSLLVGFKDGRKMFSADISNFNLFVIQNINRTIAEHNRAWPNCPAEITGASYNREKKTLRVATEVDHDHGKRLNLTYIVYTRKGMLTFFGSLDPADDQAMAAMDEAVMGLYLDDDVRY